MPRFKIFTPIRCCRDGVKFYYYSVHVFNVKIQEWVFVKSFCAMERAEQFLEELKGRIKAGDYSCLTLRT